MKKIGFMIFFLLICLNLSVLANEITPEFSLNNLDGAKVSLTDYQNKSMVLVVFWATWCPSCRAEIPELNKMAEQYKDKLEILGINIKETPKKITDFKVKNTINYQILLDAKGDVAQKYKVVGIPTNILIDKDGKIIYNGYNLEDCKKLIQ
jgi:peroxiredoxin